MTSTTPFAVQLEDGLGMGGCLISAVFGDVWRWDVTFHEDRTRMTKPNTGQVMATLNNLAISLLRYAGATNIAAARR